jgi:hypothetical protein
MTGLDPTTLRWLTAPVTAIGRHVRLIHVHACAAASLKASPRLVDGVDFNRLSRR